jgi:hypothetical protein
MKTLTDQIIKNSLEDVKQFLLKNNYFTGCSESYPQKTIFDFDDHPSAWRELARLIVEEEFLAEDVYKAISQGIENVAPWNFVSFSIPEEDYRLFIVTKNAYRLFVQSLLDSVKEEV